MEIYSRLVLVLPWLLQCAGFSTAVVSNSRKCPLVKKIRRYDFVVGILSPRAGDSPLQQWVEDSQRRAGQETSRVKECFATTNYVTLTVEDTLKIPGNGWSHIEAGIENAIDAQAQNKRDAGLSVVIGPFYMNLAMILEDAGIPYLVTDYMGFDWSDVSRVGDNVQWQTIVEVRPPMSEFNRAVVDYFVLNRWESAVLIMPESPKDNQECQNLASQMVENNISPIAYTVRYENGSQMRNSAQELLRNVQLLEQKQIIVCSPRDEMQHLISIVLDEARLFKMLEDEDYSFFLLDPTTHLQPLSEIHMYRKGLFAANCKLLAYRYKDMTNETEVHSTGYAFGAMDAAKIIRDARYWFATDTRGIPPSDIFSKDRFLKKLKQVTILNQETGDIKFNESGSRINYTLSLYNHGGMGLYSKEGSWTPTGASPEERFVFEERNKTEEQETRGIFRDVEKVVVVLEEPFVMKRNKHEGVVLEGNEQYEGFTVDLLNRISQDLQFRYEFVLSPENAYGQADKDGVWNGMVGEILQGTATMGMGAISITSLRETVIDFSLGILSTGVNILITKPQEKFNMFQFLEPFSLELWMAIIGSSFGVSLVYFILDFRNKKNRKFTIRSTLWFSIGTLLMKGSDFSPRPTSQRILTTGFLFFVLITVSSYTANMAAFLTKKNLEEPIDSFDQLAKRDIPILTVRDSATMKFLESSQEVSVYNKIWEKVKRNNGLVPNATVGRERVEEGNAAFIFDSSINSFSEKKYCRTQSVSSPILLQEHGIAMAAGAPFKSQLNIEMLRLKEEGFIQELRKKWWENTRECDEEFVSKSSMQVAFQLKHTAGVFIVGVFGLGCSLVFFLFKKLYTITQRDPVPVAKDNKSDGSSSGRNGEEKVKDPLIYGMGEGKQSTV